MAEKKALIVLLGANGQLGRSLLRYFSSEEQWKASDCFPITRAECDFEKKQEVEGLFHLLDNLYKERNYGTCIVVNTVAYTQVDQAEVEEERAMYLNAYLVADLAREIDARGWAMVQISTDYVFDGKKRTPYLTTDIPHPLSVYGRSKYEGELALQNNIMRGRGVVVRTSWLYAPFGKNFLKTILHLARSKKELRVVADQCGAPTYAPHLAEYIGGLCQKFVDTGLFSSFINHFCDQGEISWYGFAKEIVKEASLEASCRVLPITTEDYPTLALRPAYSLLALESTIYPCCPWQLGVKKCIEELSLLDDI